MDRQLDGQADRILYDSQDHANIAVSRGKWNATSCVAYCTGANSEIRQEIETVRATFKLRRNDGENNNDDDD